MDQKTYNNFIRNLSNIQYIETVEKQYRKAQEERNKFYKFVKDKYGVTVYWAGGKFHITYPNVETGSSFDSEHDGIVWLVVKLQGVK